MSKQLADSADDLVTAMRSSPILASTPAAAVRELAEQGRIRRYRRGTYLFHQEDEAEDIHFLCTGRVEISSLSPSGQRQWHTTIEQPQFVGELGILGEMPRTAGVLALEDSEVWSVAGDKFISFLVAQPSASLGLLRALARQIQAYGGLVDDLLYLDLKGRLAKRLLGLVSPSLDDLASDGAVLPLVTHADLASLAGGSRENVSRIMSDFQRRGFVGRSGRRYVLGNVKGLAKLAGL